MNGQLNGFHEAFIEEGTFLFTSESVGEGHPGEVNPGAKRGAGRRQSWACPGPAGGGAHSRYPGLLGSGNSGGCAPSSWRRGCPARGRCSPPPSSPFLPSHPAARLGLRKIPENEKGGGCGISYSTRGGHYFLLSALASEKSRVGDPLRALAPGPRERAPRIAAATTCLQHVASGPPEPSGSGSARVYQVGSPFFVTPFLP